MRLMKAGATSQSIYIEVLDSASTTGGRKTGIVYNAAGLTAYYVRNQGSAVQITLASLTNPNSAWSSGGFKEVDATNMPGIYRLDVPDAAVATGVPSIVVTIKGASGMVQVSEEIQLTGYDMQGTTVEANMVQVSGDATAADNLETMLDGTGGQVLSLKQISVVNSTGDAILAQSTGSNGSGIHAIAHGTGDGIRGNGGASGIGAYGSGENGLTAVGGSGKAGIYAAGGGLTGADGAGILAIGGSEDRSGNGHGIEALGSGADAAGFYVEGESGPGMRANGGTGGHGMELNGDDDGAGLYAIAGANGGNGISAYAQADGWAGFEAGGDGATGFGIIGYGATAGIQGTGSTNGDGIVGDGNGTGKDIRGNIEGSLSGSVGSVTAAVMITAAAVNAIWDQLLATITTVGSVGKLIKDNLAAIVATLGTPSNLGSGATVAGNLVDIENQTDDIGAAGAGLTAIGDTRLANLDATVSSRATASNLAIVAGYLDTEVATILAAVDTEVAAILADTNELQTDWVNGGRLDNILDARASQTSVDDIPTNSELTTALASADDATLAAIAALNNLSAAQVNAEVVDALNVDTYGEPGQEAPPVSASIQKKNSYLYKALRNRLTQTATESKLYADNGTTVDQKAAVSDDGTTFDRGEFGSGP